jgi:hypothetical protein
LFLTDGSALGTDADVQTQYRLMWSGLKGTNMLFVP